ncbi:MAG: peptide-methionine (S)-S-oxide reductase, partial [Rhodocyclales bacterium]|nr:peptide-methionine (S)-S-oxide reductase [Rhodocyclales bacterium]
MNSSNLSSLSPIVLKNTPANAESIVLGMGCFWGAEKRMSELPGVLNVESGYANGDIPGNYEAVLAHERALQYGRAQGRNHAEVVKVTFDPARVTLSEVLARFWESHDPTQGDRQGNDIGSNYRSAIYIQNEKQLETALKTREV